MDADNGPEERRFPTSFWLDDESRESLVRLQKELGLNRSAVVREAIRKMDSGTDNAEVRRLVAELERVVSGGSLGS